MTLNETTTLIATNLKRELDMPFKLQLAERVKYWRSRLIKNSLDKDSKDRKFFKQVIYMVMEKSSNVPCCDMFPGCEVAITKDVVPAPLRANSILFDYIGAADGMTPFYETTASNLPILATGKYSKRRLWYLWENRKIVVYGNPNLPLLRLDDVFDDPAAVDPYICKPGTTDDCNIWDREYPCSNDIMQMIVQMILQVDYNLRTPIVPDRTEIPVSASLKPD